MIEPNPIAPRSSGRYGDGMIRTVFAAAFLATLGHSAACTCAERTAEDPQDDELLERRLAGCESLCEAQAGDCGPLPNDLIKSHDDCVRECATLEGDLAGGWGYQYSTDRDECAPEWQLHTQCVTALSCTDQQLYWKPAEQSPPPEERPCHEEWQAMTNCVYEHPCCGERDG